MSCLSAKAVLEPLYNFLQMAYGPELKSLERIPFSTEAERWVFTRLAEAPLSIRKPYSWSRIESAFLLCC